MLSAIATLPISLLHFCMPPKPKFHPTSTQSSNTNGQSYKIPKPNFYPTSRFLKTMQPNPATPMPNHKNKWEVRTHEWILCCDNNSLPMIWRYYQHHLKGRQRLSCNNWQHPQCTCPNFTKISSHALGKKCIWVHCKHLYYVYKFFCEVDYNNDEFIMEYVEAPFRI